MSNGEGKKLPTSQWKIISEKSRKRVDKWGRWWYPIKAVCETAVFQTKSEFEWENKNHLTVRKKFLTSELRHGKLIKSPVKAANKGDARRADRKSLKVQKTWKKFLTRSKRCGKMNSRRCKRCVPCKLNNVTNTKHQIGFGCSNKLSLKDDRKFLWSLVLSFNKVIWRARAL